MICCKSYQDIPEDPRYAGPDTEDYFDMFYTEFCKRNGIKDLSDNNYETVRRWWYEFVNGRGEEWDYGCDMTLEEMFAELKEYDENREKHTCETCERKRDEIFCSHCRTGCNDDYTLSDYWHSYTRVEKLLWKRISQLQNDKGELVDRCRELEAQIEKMKCCGNCENGELSAHEEPCRHCQRCFASKDVTDQENVKDNWEAIKEIKENEL